MLKSMFMHKAAAFSWVHRHYASYVYGEVWFIMCCLCLLTYLVFVTVEVQWNLA